MDRIGDGKRRNFKVEASISYDACAGAPTTIKPGAASVMKEALEIIAQGPCCESPGCTLNDPVCESMIARNALYEAFGVEEQET